MPDNQSETLMDPQILVILFLIFSAISSVYKKLKERSAPDESKLQRKHPSREVATGPFEEKEVDLSEWESLFGLPTSEPEPKPEPKPAPPPEFQEVHGKRPVSEADTGPEFQEVQGKRPVEETDTGPEFQEIQGKRPVSDQSSYTEGHTDFIRASQTHLSRPKKRKRQHHLKFNRTTIRQAIIYNEILGPPRADKMPF